MSTSPRAVRRFPHLTREDVEMLQQMPEEMARSYEALIEQQWRSDRRHEQHCAGDVAELEYAVHRRVHGQGAGGGQRRGSPPGVPRE